MQIPVEELIEHFSFLDALRESGAVNMFGAGPILQKEMGLDRKTAKAATLAWMKTFDGQRSPQERAEEFVNNNESA